MIVAQAASAFHTPFLYRVERFEADGNVLGVPGIVDDFNGTSLAPYWYPAYGTSSESNGFLVLSNPGVHFPAPPDPASPSGALLDLSIAASAQPTWVYDGHGDFTGTAYWEGVLPAVGHHYHFSLFTFGGQGGLYAETFGIALLRRDDDSVQVEQHLTEIDQYSGTFQNTQLLYHDVDPSQATGPFIFRISFNDATNQATTAYSLDGGTTWDSPFPPGVIFQGRTQAQFLLSADPNAGPGNVTTTTVPSSTTTSTLPGGPCVATGCRQSTAMFKSKLVVRDKSNDTADSISWKWKKGALTTLPNLGNPSDWTNYWFCLGDASGSVYNLELPRGGGWNVSGSGITYADYSGTIGGLRKLMVRGGAQGKASIVMKIQGANAGLPDLPLSLPITARLSNSLGECWAEEFDTVGMTANSATVFSGKSH
jgi:hypothetical protein